MKLIAGDLLAGAQFSAGRYVEKVKLKGTDFFKIEDVNNRAIHYVSVNDLEKMRKLPSIKTVKDYLKILSSTKLIDVESSGLTRYQHLKNKAKSASFKKLVECLHDLHLLRETKKASTSEVKLYNSTKKKLFEEVSIVLDTPQEELEAVYL